MKFILRLFRAKAAKKKANEYREYIDEHRRNILRAWKEMQEKCKDDPFIYDDWKFACLDSAVKEHDLSKYSPEEFEPYRQYFYPCKGESSDHDAFDAAWKRHYENNPHHWEYWVGRPDGGLYQSLCYTEMVLDWTAMGYRFGGTALEYYEKHKAEIQIVPLYVECVEQLLTRMVAK
jgi:hypothetical protein